VTSSSASRPSPSACSSPSAWSRRWSGCIIVTRLHQLEEELHDEARENAIRIDAEQYSTLIGETYAADLAAKNRLRIFQWIHNTVLRDLTPEAAAADRPAALQSHPDRFPSPASGTPYAGAPAAPSAAE
jgi:hypothetical protein